MTVLSLLAPRYGTNGAFVHGGNVGDSVGFSSTTTLESVLSFFTTVGLATPGDELDGDGATLLFVDAVVLLVVLEPTPWARLFNMSFRDAEMVLPVTVGAALALPGKEDAAQESILAKQPCVTS